MGGTEKSRRRVDFQEECSGDVRTMGFVPGCSLVGLGDGQIDCRRGKWRPSLCASWWQGWIGRGCSEGNVCSQWRPKEGGVAMVTECGVCSPGNRSSQEQMGGLGWAGLMSSSHSYETKHLSTPELLLHICPHKEGPPLPKRSIFHFYCD